MATTSNTIRRSRRPAEEPATATTRSSVPWRGRHVEADGAGNVAIVDDVAPAPDGWCASAFSIVSPGTEMWHVERARQLGQPAPLGYMTVGRAPGGGAWLMAPVPHGAAFPADASGLLRARLTAERLAIARFMLVAASALRPAAALWRADPILVLGSGPVALGAVLELLRTTSAEIFVASSAPDRAARLLRGIPRVHIGSMSLAAVVPVIIDCTGRPDVIAQAISVAGPGAFLGLLGSPRSSAPLDLYAIHRSALRVVGLHELTGDSASLRQSLLDELAAWLAAHPRIGRTWVRRWRAVDVPALYRALRDRRVVEPINIVVWGADGEAAISTVNR